ncbi:hypothetical protein [Deinococcus navajonensis]|uniref:Uncharacterized protein n=1 Tax=Deinococcus navajonensis TaxID=309884 RepID=A0ABV8XW09_9DEIO
MTPAPNPTWFDPSTWPTFALHGPNGLLIRLPPTVKPTSPLGQPDPYTWDRPPGSGAWFALGDGLPTQRPTLTLEGVWKYNSREEALAGMAAIQAVLPLATSLYWVGQPFQDLDLTFPGSYLATFGASANDLTHRLVLNVRGTPVTGTPGQPIPGTNPPPPDTGYY